MIEWIYRIQSAGFAAGSILYSLGVLNGASNDTLLALVMLILCLQFYVLAEERKHRA